MAERSRTCILIEFADGSLRAFDYPDERSAKSWYDECRDDWRFARTVLFYLRRGNLAPTTEVHRGNDVVRFELTTRDDARERGAEIRDAVILG